MGHHQNTQTQVNLNKNQRPDDTKYTADTDPRKLFNHQFHAVDRFFDMGQDFDNFNVNTNNFNNQKTDLVTKHHPGGEIPRTQRAELSKEKRNFNQVKNEEMLSLRSKLFDDRKPGGYYIKVFNNDGNNYS